MCDLFPTSSPCIPSSLLVRLQVPAKKPVLVGGGDEDKEKAKMADAIKVLAQPIPQRPRSPPRVDSGKDGRRGPKAQAEGCSPHFTCCSPLCR